MTEPTPLEAAQKLLIGAAIGSCTCNTKSPELIWHVPNCRYVTIMTALENVELAAAHADEELQGPPNWHTWKGSVLYAGERQVTENPRAGAEPCTIAPELTTSRGRPDPRGDASGPNSEFDSRDGGHVFAIHDALSKANLEYSAYSCSGLNLFGDRKSIDAATRAFHSHGQIDWYQRNLRHWRDECGKLHSKLAIQNSRLSNREQITPEMIDRALHGWFSVKPTDSESDAVLERSMRAALEAALSAVIHEENT